MKDLLTRLFLKEILQGEINILQRSMFNSNRFINKMNENFHKYLKTVSLKKKESVRDCLLYCVHIVVCCYNVHVIRLQIQIFCSNSIYKVTHYQCIFRCTCLGYASVMSCFLDYVGVPK